jgi:YegS/Rv2252/BmrU family lipid kinase
MYNFILNPAAGKGKAVKFMNKIKTFLDINSIRYIVHNTLYPGHASEIAAQISGEGAENIIAVGGDGTVNETLNGIRDFEKCALGIIPAGSGNDFSKFINLPKDPVEAMKRIINTEPRYTDFLTINGKRAINVAGMGMDVSVIKRCSRMKYIKGKLQYLVSLLITLLKFDWHKFKVSIDGKEEQEKTTLMIAACNGKYFGGGMPISPESDISDNFLNVIIINKLKKWKIPLALINLYRGKILKYNFVENILCKSVVITPLNSGSDANIDGELCQNITFDCKLVKNQLKMFR